MGFSGLTPISAKSVGLFSLDLETFGHYVSKYFIYNLTSKDVLSLCACECGMSEA